MTYAKTKTVDSEYEETIDRVTEALAHEGCRILSDVDVQAAFKETLDSNDRLSISCVSESWSADQNQR